jgi:predicted RecB family nuclease
MNRTITIPDNNCPVQWADEKQILEGFLEYIKNIKNPILLSYSGIGFDKNVLYYALKRHNLDADFFHNLPHYDLCSLLKRSFIFPTRGYGLKEVSKFLGYNYESDKYDGLYVALRYIRCQNTGEKLPKEIHNYIKDDVYSMDHIINELGKKNLEIKDLNLATIEDSDDLDKIRKSKRKVAKEKAKLLADRIAELE